MEKQANTSLYIPDKLKRNLKVYAAINDKSVSECIIEAVTNYLKRK